MEAADRFHAGGCCSRERAGILGVMLTRCCAKLMRLQVQKRLLFRTGEVLVRESQR